MSDHNDLATRSLRLLSYYRGQVWWIVSRVFLLTVVISALGLALWPRYVARTKITLLPSRTEIGFAAGRPELWGRSPIAILAQTHAESLLSRTLAEDVARTVLADPATGGKPAGVMAGFRRLVVMPVKGLVQHLITLLNTGRWQTADPFMSLVYAIQGRTQVENLPGSFVFQVGVTWDDPAIAAHMANLITERYVQMALRASQEEMLATREFIEGRIAETRADLDLVEDKIKAFRVEQKIYTTSTDLDLGLQEMSQYLRDYNETRVGWEQLDARITALKGFQTPAGLANVEAERKGLRTRQEALNKVIAGQFDKLDQLPSKEAGLLDFYRTRATKERDLGTLQDRLLDTRVAEAAQLGAVRVIDTAIPPLYPDRPALLRNGAMSILVGAFLSLGYIVLAESRRAHLQCRRDVPSAAGLFLGLVPHVVNGGKNILDEGDGRGRLAECLRRLVYGPFGTAEHGVVVRRHLQHLLAGLRDGGQGRCWAFASVAGGEGKTFLIEQLATLAQEAGHRVLLIDGNLNAPGLHARFGKNTGPGLAELLATNAVARDMVVPINARTDLIGAGVVGPNGQAHWDLTKAKDGLAQLARAYDLVLMDTAALRHDPAAARVLALADGVVCVFDATTSRREDPDELVDRLHGMSGRMHYVLNRVMYAPDFLFTAGGRQAAEKKKAGMRPLA